MKAIARLVLTYFAGSRLSKYVTLSGLLLMLASLYVVLYLPQREHMLALALPGVLLFFFGNSEMPVILGRLSRSHAACILPGARVKLLISAILTVLLVGLPVALLTPLAFVAGMSAEVSVLFEQPMLFEYTLGLALITYTSACIAATWLHAFMWFITNERNLAGAGKAAYIFLGLILLAVVFGRLSQEREPGAVLRENVQHLAILALVFSSGFLAWPRFRRWQAGRRRSISIARSNRDIGGKEVDLLLGIPNPWLFIVASLIPTTFLVVAGDSTELLFFVTIASTAAGAIAGNAPARSRAAWLRAGWSRTELYARIEKLVWRHNARVLLALLLILLAAGSLSKLPPSVLGVGIALIVLGGALSIYLGLTLTRGLRWPEASLGAAVMLALMAISRVIGQHTISWGWSASVLIVLALLAIVLRQVARVRWARIDWSQCRDVTQRALRAG